MPELAMDAEWPGESSPEQDVKKSESSSNERKLVLKPISAYNSFKNKLFGCTRYRESIFDLRKRAERAKYLDDFILLKAVKANYRFIYRINDGIGTTNTILQKVCEERGWREFQERQAGTAYERAMRSATGWNLFWHYSIYQFSPYKYLRNWQYTNHNPKGFQFCNKLYLTMFLRKMKSIHGSIFDFYPNSYIIPEDYVRLLSDHSTRSDSFSMYNHNNLLVNPNFMKALESKPKDIAAAIISHNNSKRRPKTSVSVMGNTTTNNTKPPTASISTSSYVFAEPRFVPIWISKPVAQSQGKGIFLTSEVCSIATDKKSVVQEYISRPLLIGGYKWDIRIYVCVAAIDPLVIYIYQEGLCRFATEKYNTTDLAAMYSHLTNASLNKLSPAYEEDKELIGQGCKWSLRKLREYFRDRNVADWFMWQRIMALVVLTVIGDSLRLGYSASNRNCFDLFGFDVLVDEELKPWLLECNYSPGLGGDCETDEIVKRPMLHDLFNLLGFPDKSSYRNESTPKCNGNEDVLSLTDVVRSESGTKVDAARQYVDLLLHRIANDGSVEKKRKPSKWKQDFAYCTAARLSDAKSIYSQNLVVQYLKNQAGGKMCKQVKDQIISIAEKKLKKAESKNKPKTTAQNSPAQPQATSSETKNSTTEKPKETKTVELLPPPQENKVKTKTPDFPHPDSEAFQRLKHYFDAGVDYPVDIKTGMFKECPALITIKKDWFNPPKQQGQWIRVYPFDARTTKSPYKSSLTDIRQAVRSIESYMKVAEHLFMVKPNESDDYYRRKMKSICRRETEIWTPPSVWGTSGLIPNCDLNGNEDISSELPDLSK